MKKLIALVLLAASAFVAQAQTNIAYRITVDGVNTAWTYDVTGTKKDQARVAGLIYAYGVYAAAQGTNAVLALGPWLRRQHVVLVDDYANQKQTADNAALAEKLISLLTVNSDLLNAADLAALNTVAAKAP